MRAYANPVDYVFFTKKHPLDVLAFGLIPESTERNIIRYAIDELPRGLLTGFRLTDETSAASTFSSNLLSLTSITVRFNQELPDTTNNYSVAFDNRLRMLRAVDPQVPSISITDFPNSQTRNDAYARNPSQTSSNQTVRIILNEMDIISREHAEHEASIFLTFLYSNIDASSIVRVTNWTWNNPANHWERGLE